MPYIPINPPDGLLLNGTEYEAQSRWRNGNLIRFFRGAPQPVGGWTRLPLTTYDQDSQVLLLDSLLGVCRGSLTWRDLDENRWIAFGTTDRLYAHNGSEIFDITPSGLPTGDDNAVYGPGYSAYYYNEDHTNVDSHTGGTSAYSTERPASIASLVQEPGAWTLANWGEDLIACPNWFGRIYKWSPGDVQATQIYNGSGEVPEAVRAICVSNERHLVAVGSGTWTGVYWDKDQRRVMWSTSEDHDTWTPTPTNSAGDLQLETEGLALAAAKFKDEILIWTDIDVHRMRYLGPPYFYGINRISPTAGIFGLKSYVVTSEFVFWVGPQGFLIYDGAVRELNPEISDYYRDDITRDNAQASKVTCGHNPKFNEIWTFYPSRDQTEIDSYVIWNYETNTWTVGQLSRSMWNEAHIWGNPIASKPVNIPETTGVQYDITLGQMYNTIVYTRDKWLKVFGYNIDQSNPNGFHNITVENVVVKVGANTKVLSTDYELDVSLGLIKFLSSGSIGASDTVTLQFDLPAASYSVVYNHEDGYTNDGASRNADIWVETAPFEIGTGDNLSVVRRIMQDTGREDDPDPQLNSDAIQVYFKTRLAPEGPLITEGPYELDAIRGYTDIRFTARQVQMKIVQVKDELWRYGKHRLEIVPGSMR